MITQDTATENYKQKQNKLNSENVQLNEYPFGTLRVTPCKAKNTYFKQSD